MSPEAREVRNRLVALSKAKNQKEHGTATRGSARSRSVRIYEAFRRELDRPICLSVLWTTQNQSSQPRGPVSPHSITRECPLPRGIQPWRPYHVRCCPRWLRYRTAACSGVVIGNRQKATISRLSHVSGNLSYSALGDRDRSRAIVHSAGQKAWPGNALERGTYGPPQELRLQRKEPQPAIYGRRSWQSPSDCSPARDLSIRSILLV